MRKQADEGSILSHPFGAIYSQDSKVLILGSFPSVKSRENMFFYAHPQNRFWKVIAYLTGDALPQNIEEKKTILLKNHFALWDVLSECRISGSSDLSINAEKPNNLNEIFSTARIQVVGLNGGAAYTFYKKYHSERYQVPYIKLPSTSSANASCSLESLVEKWRNALSLYCNYR